MIEDTPQPITSAPMVKEVEGISAARAAMADAEAAAAAADAAGPGDKAVSAMVASQVEKSTPCSDIKSADGERGSRVAHDLL